MIKCAYKNILESGTVSLTEGTEDAEHPLYRLYDRGVGNMFRAQAAGTVEIRIDQGSTAPIVVDRLFIPKGHNLEGATLSALHSDDDQNYVTCDEWSATNGLISRSWTPIAKRYWKLRIAGAASAPELAELFLTSTYEWEHNPERPAGPLEEAFNVERSQTAGGSDRFLRHGPPRRKRRYRMSRCGGGQKDNMIALSDAWRGSRPLWLEDHESSWIYGRLESPLNLRETGHQSYAFDFDFVEVVP